MQELLYPTTLRMHQPPIEADRRAVNLQRQALGNHVGSFGIVQLECDLVAGRSSHSLTVAVDPVQQAALQGAIADRHPAGVGGTE